MGLALVALVLVASMVVLGLWQLGVYDDQQRSDARERADRTPVPLTESLGPDDPFPADLVGMPVTVSGTYAPRDQLYVEGLPGSGHRYAVVTPLVVQESAILVVRGSTDDLGASPPAGPVTVEGLLEPPMPAGSRLDRHRVTDALNIARLVEGVNRDLYSGYVVLEGSVPAERLPAVAPPLPDPSRWAGIRNLVYAVQWWVFAGFVVFMWWRIVHEADDYDDERVR